MDDHFARVFGATQVAATTDVSDKHFIPSSSFAGRKEGYVFGTVSGRTGYFVDPALTGNKRKRGADDATALSLKTARKHEPLDGAALLEEIEAEQSMENVLDLDLNGLKCLLLNFEKKINKNQRLRVKFPDEPTKFLDSECDLDNEVKNLYAIAASPELYPDLVKLGCVTSLLGILSHENTDISISVIGLLQELTDPQSAVEAEEEVNALVDALVKEQGLELLIQNLSRLDESNTEDADGVHNTMAIIENLSEIRPVLCSHLCEKTGLLKFLLKRLKVRKFDANKLYASEVLSVLLQADTANAKRLGELQGMDGIDLLLQSLSYYRKRAPTGEEERECIENLFTSLCIALMIPANQTRFRHSEGFELMVRCMKGKNYAGSCALRVLDFATNGNATNCDRLVEVGGLKVLFPAFMGKGVVRKSKRQRQKALHERRSNEEHVISIIASLCLQLQLSDEHKSDALGRLVSKFLETELEKVDRLVELVIEYKSRLKAFDARPPQEDMSEDSEDDEETDLYARRLDSGLFVLQMLSTITGTIVIHSPLVRKRVIEKLHQKNHSGQDIKDVLLEYAGTLGESLKKKSENELTSDPSTTDAKEKKKCEMVASLAVSFPVL